MGQAGHHRTDRPQCRRRRSQLRDRRTGLRVRSVDLMSADSNIYVNVSVFLDQTEWWVTKSGLKRIDDMTSLHRRRAAMHLLRKAPWLAVNVRCAWNDEASILDTFGL